MNSDANLEYIEETVRNGIKTVNKKYYDLYSEKVVKNSPDRLWILSLSELGFSTEYDAGNCYPVFTDGKSLTTADSDLPTLFNMDFSMWVPPYLVRDSHTLTGSQNTSYWYSISNTGLPQKTANNNRDGACVQCFCI